MSEITLNAVIRKNLGKRARRLRTEGKVPGIYYGHGQENIPVELAEVTLQPLYRTTAMHVINLKLDDGSAHQCILRQVQFDPVTEKPLHFDLFGLNEQEELILEVPVTVKGAPKGVKDGGMLQHILHKVRVSCLPKYIPDHIEVNVEHLEINKSIHISDLSIPNVRILENEHSAIVAVVPPTILKEATPEVVATEVVPAEPEVIGKGKKPEDGAEGAPTEEKGKEKAKEKEKGKEKK
jgi:large subunit ribosomal protein L25